MPNPSTRVCAHTRVRNFLSASPAWAVEFWSEPRHWPLGICWSSTAGDSWLVDVKANLAKIPAVTLLPSAPFSSTIMPLPLWEWEQRLSWKLWGSLTLIRRSLLVQRMCSHQWEWRNGAAGSKSSAKHFCYPLYQPSLLDPCKELPNLILDFSLLSQLVPVLLPGGVSDLRKQRDWKEAEKGAWQRRLGRGRCES